MRLSGLVLVVVSSGDLTPSRGFLLLLAPSLSGVLMAFFFPLLHFGFLLLVTFFYCLFQAHFLSRVLMATAGANKIYLFFISFFHRNLLLSSDFCFQQT